MNPAEPKVAFERLETDAKEVESMEGQLRDKIKQSQDPQKMTLGSIIREIILLERYSYMASVDVPLLKTYSGTTVFIPEEEINVRLGELYVALDHKEQLYGINSK